MKLKKVIETFWIICVIGFVILLIYAVFSTLINTEIEDHKDNKFCANKLGLEHSWGNTLSDGFHYETIGKDYINCCWESPHLNEEGIYEKYQCKGFRKVRI